jgi:hypothetical protein
MAVTTHTWNISEQCNMKLIGQASQEAFTAATMAGAFRRCGLVPFDPEHVLCRLRKPDSAQQDATVAEGLPELDSDSGEGSSEGEEVPAAVPAPTVAAAAGPSSSPLQPLDQGSSGAGGAAGKAAGGAAGGSRAGRGGRGRRTAADMPTRQASAGAKRPRPAARKYSSSSDSDPEWESEGSE